MSHTPGPWIWVDGELYPEAAYRRYETWRESAETPTKWNEDWQACPEAIVETDSGVYGPRGADKPLIAAAPDLLTACRFIVDFHNQVFLSGRPLCIDGQPIDHTLLNEAARLAESALSKAEGDPSSLRAGEPR